MEVAGTVDALGEGVRAPPPATRVAVLGGHGGLAEYGCFPARRVVPLPDACGFEIAAGFQIAYGTATWRWTTGRGCSRARRCWCWGPPAASG